MLDYLDGITAIFPEEDQSSKEIRRTKMSLQITRPNPIVKRVKGQPVLRHFKDQFVAETLEYVPHDGDIIVASYPKTGTTWLQYIVLQIVSKGEIYPTNMHQLGQVISPFMEMVGSTVLDKMIAPRIYNHHMPFNAVQKNPLSKVIYIYRHPGDTFISYYHFMRSYYPDEVEFDEYFVFFLSGDIAYGRYFEHVLSYLEHEKDENLLLVSYEKMKKDPKKELLRIAEFLGETYHKYLVENKMALEKMLEKTSFEYMKKNVSTQGLKNPKVKFFRKGSVGEAKEYLSIEQQKRLRDKSEETMQDAEALKEWYGKSC